MDNLEVILQDIAAENPEFDQFLKNVAAVIVNNEGSGIEVSHGNTAGAIKWKNVDSTKPGGVMVSINDDR